MIERAITRRFFLAPPALKSFLPRHVSRVLPFVRNSSGLPSITQPSFWAGLVPKPLKRGSEQTAKKSKSKEWNPATFFIISLMLIGSMSIQMIKLRHDHSTFTRRADVRIELLREVLERVQRGEDVDVEVLLGTGDPAKEDEWEQVMKEIEEEDDFWEESQRKKAKRRAVTKKSSSISADAEILLEKPTTKEDTQPKETVLKSSAPSGFY